MRNDISEDPTHPKVQFPSKYLCATCQLNSNEYDHSITIEFLLKYYSKANMDKSLISKKPFEDISDRPERVISKIEYIDQTGFFIHIFQHFSVYILLGVLIVLVFIRRQCCQSKGKRYRL